MDALAVKQAVKYAKEYALKSGPFVRPSFSSLVFYLARKL